MTAIRAQYRARARARARARTRTRTRIQNSLVAWTYSSCMRPSGEHPLQLLITSSVLLSASTVFPSTSWLLETRDKSIRVAKLSE